MIICVIDLETTGLPKNNECDPTNINAFNASRMIEFAGIIYDSESKETIKKVAYLIQPDGFTINNSNFHGITNKIAHDDGITINTFFEHFNELIEQFECLLSYNLEFDLSVLLSELYRYDQIELYNKILDKRFVCVMKCMMNLFNSTKYISLKESCRRLGISYENKHRALYDAELALKCIQRIKELKMQNNKKAKFISYKCKVKPIIKNKPIEICNDDITYFPPGCGMHPYNKRCDACFYSSLSSGCIWCGGSDETEMCYDCLTRD